MPARSLPGFTAEMALERFSAFTVSQTVADTSGTTSGLIPAVECSKGVPGTLSVEEYLGSYYVCCCPDDFRKPCDCTGIV